MRNTVKAAQGWKCNSQTKNPHEVHMDKVSYSDEEKIELFSIMTK